MMGALPGAVLGEAPRNMTWLRRATAATARLLISGPEDHCHAAPAQPLLDQVTADPGSRPNAVQCG
jgi:hypothetical protein